jgi:hypothetical protein
MSEEPKSNKPTHELKLLDTDSGDTSIVGVAWAKENGTVSLKLNPGVVLSYDNLKGKFLTLFRVRSKEEWDVYHEEKRQREKAEAEGKPDYVGVKNWKKDHPEYIRKIHWNYSTRRECPSRSLGHPEVTEDSKAVTCGKCKKVIQKRRDNPPPMT